MNILSQLKQLRKVEKITQEEVAEILGINKNYYSMLETGLRTPSFKLAKKIADLFNSSVDEIFFNEINNKTLRKHDT